MTRSRIDGAIGGGGGGGGSPGPQGDPGPPGVGVPTGGTTGQVLAKNTATDYDTGWTLPSGVAPSTWDANSIVKADVDNAPIPLVVGASTMVGRGAAGSIAALTVAQVKTLLALMAADIANFDTQVRTSRLDQMAAPTAPVDFGGQNLTNANWAGTTIPLTAGGTGATTAASARSNLGTMGKFNGTIGDGTTTSFTVTHNLQRTAVAVELYDTSTMETITARVTRLSTTQMRLDFAPAPPVNSVGIIAWA